MTTQKPVIIPSASLHGKVAVITGSGRGIGRASALEMGRRGASVVVNYAHSKASAEEVCKAIESNGTGARSISVQADVSKLDEIDKLFRTAKERFGHIDVVMSNSGIESWDNIEEITQDKFDHVFNLNARAQFFVAQAGYKYLEHGGRIILTSSISAGNIGIFNHALYNSSKMSVVGMVTAFATDFGKRGIRVNGLRPGGVKSNMFVEHAWRYIPGATPDWPAEKVEKALADGCALGRCAEVDDIAPVACFLASDDSGWVNGTYIRSLDFLTSHTFFIADFFLW